MEGLMMDYELLLTSILERARQMYPDKEIVSKTPEGMHRYTYADLYTRVSQLANVLKKLGVEPGDRVGTFAFNHYRHLELYFAAPCSGAVLHTLNIRLFPEHLVYVANHGGDKVLFVDAAVLPAIERVQDQLETIEHFVIMGGGPEPKTTLSPAYDYETLMADASQEYDFPKLDENTAAMMCYTSGTTGQPKGVVYSHRAFFLHSMASAMSTTLGVAESDTLLIVVPQFHVNAWGMPFTCAMTGAKQVFPGPFMQPQHLAQLIQDEKVTVAAGVPTLWFGLYQHLKEQAYDTSRLRAMIVGGSAMPRNYFEAFEKELGINVVHAWGMTETTPLGSVSVLKSHMSDWPEEKRYDMRAKQGMAVTGVEMRIADGEGNALPRDGKTIGEVQVRGPWVVKQYYKTPVAPESFTDDGWFRTGDVATIDPEGYMFITDRTKDLIKSGGEWISSVELENTIMAHPKVAECAVIAARHAKWQERPLAIVVPAADAKDDITPGEIIEFLQGQVAKWWLPDDVVFVDELPKTSVGKFNKLALREQFADYELPTQ